MKRTLLALATTLTMASAFSASASVLDEPPVKEPSNWELSVNYLDIRSESGSAELNVGVLGAGFAYEFMQEGGHLSYTPELILGVGVENDRYLGYEVDVDTLVVGAVRIALHPTDEFEVFVRPSYSKISVSVDDIGSETGDWEFGVGAGIGYNVTKEVNLAITFDRVAGDSDVLGASVRYRF